MSSISLRTVPITRLAILVTWAVILTSNVPVWMAHFTHEIENGLFHLKGLGVLLYSIVKLLQNFYLIPNLIFSTICNWSITFEYFLDTVVCVFDMEHYSLRGFHISFFVTSFALPTLLILLMYLVMLFRLWRSSSCTISKYRALKIPD